MNSKNDNAKELFAQFGLAAYKAQLLECEATSLVILLLKDSVQSEDQEFLSAVELGIETQTLGRVLRLIEERVVFGQGAKDIIVSALKKRNHVVHHFFRIHAQNALCEEGRHLMIQELNEAGALFVEADNLLHSISRVMFAAKGVSGDRLEELMSEELNKLGLGK